MCQTLQVRLNPPALSIQALYPLSSLSICCWRRSFMKALRFSTLSLSLANSLKSQTKPQKHIFALQDPGIVSYIILHLGGILWIKIQTSSWSVNHESRGEEARQRGSHLFQCGDNDNESPINLAAELINLYRHWHRILKQNGWSWQRPMRWRIWKVYSINGFNFKIHLIFSILQNYINDLMILVCVD